MYQCGDCEGGGGGMWEKVKEGIGGLYGDGENIFHKTIAYLLKH